MLYSLAWTSYCRLPFYSIASMISGVSNVMTRSHNIRSLEASADDNFRNKSADFGRNIQNAL
jgi:hypothetical protein